MSSQQPAFVSSLASSATQRGMLWNISVTAERLGRACRCQKRAELLAVHHHGGDYISRCHSRPTVGDPDPFALHKLLRFPQHGASLAATQPSPLHIIITGGAYVSIPLTIPDNTHITVRVVGAGCCACRQQAASQYEFEYS